jgi:polyribonucleotide nucleotidyltransferase
MTGTSDELGYIIGKAGVNVKKLTEESGANIKVNREKGTIIISGEKDKVEKAKTDITVLFEKYKKENMQINVNADFIPALIGKGGENIKKLRKELGLSIDLGAKGSGAITLRGEEELIIKAKETLLNLAAKYEKENVIVRIRPDAYSALIGKSGATIQSIQKETNTQIDVRREKK